MEFLKAFCIADIIDIVLLMIAIVSLGFTYKQLREGHKTQSAVFFKDLYTTWFDDQDLREVFYKIEYSTFKYRDKFHGSEIEKKTDKLLSVANMVCHLSIAGNISENEMKFFRYEFLRIYENRDIQRYLDYLKSWYKKNRSGVDPFSSFVEYCKNHQ